MKLALKMVTRQAQYSTSWPSVDGGSGIRGADNGMKDIRHVVAALASQSMAICLALLSLGELESRLRSCKPHFFVSLEKKYHDFDCPIRLDAGGSLWQGFQATLF